MAGSAESSSAARTGTRSAAFSPRRSPSRLDLRSGSDSSDRPSRRSRPTRRHKVGSSFSDVAFFLLVKVSEHTFESLVDRTLRPTRMAQGGETPLLDVALDL